MSYEQDRAAYEQDATEAMIRMRSPIDRKQERQFRADAPTKDMPCVVPGCPHKFRKSSQYVHFVAHYEQHHRKPS